jgi:hypothetical protein
LAQVLKLNLGESPLYANYGNPAHESVVQQVFPDFFVRRVQSQFSQYFASLIIAKVPLPTPVYNITLVTNNGVTVNANVPVPV